jgi:hypothetical protein
MYSLKPFYTGHSENTSVPNGQSVLYDGERGV